MNQKYANRVKEIRTAINALKDKVAKDYKAPHNIRTASYDADRDAIQAKINSLRSDAGAIIQNYENYQKLLKALGTETGLQKQLDDAKAAVAKMKPAAKGDAYDVAAHFQKTAAGLQKTIDQSKEAVEKAYQEKTLTETARTDFQQQIDAAAMSIGKYQDDATAAMDRYDVVNTAIKDYKDALARCVRPSVRRRSSLPLRPRRSRARPTESASPSSRQRSTVWQATSVPPKRSSMPSTLLLCWPYSSRRPSSPMPRPSMMPSPMTRSIPTRLQDRGCQGDV